MKQTKEIYLLWDRKLAIVCGATTNYEKAMQRKNELNDAERTTRYTVCTHKDFADA